MRIHGNQMNLNTINPYSAAAEKALAAQRAAAGRKKPVKRADGAEAAYTPEESLLISTWTRANQGHVAKR